VVGEKSPVANDHSHYHFSVMHCHAQTLSRASGDITFHAPNIYGNRLLETGET
jgi:hypothetical protein